MKRRVRILQYGPSAGARELSEATGIIRLKCSRTKFFPRKGDIIVNWGTSISSVPSPWAWDIVWINDPHAVTVASSKLRSLECMKEAGVNVPDFTTDPKLAQEWARSGRKVVARTLDRASGGRGIILFGENDKIPQAKLYTLYIPKHDEYRVHVWGGEVIDVQQKRRRKDFEGRNNQIRNFDNGWVFCREDVNCPEQCLDQARQAVAALGLEFGAADVGYTTRSKSAVVYEVNTAPGLEGSTITRYAEAITKHLRKLPN